jgi:hypothetical protein
MYLTIKETWVNRTQNHIVGDSGKYETRFEETNELFAFCQKEYGKCVSNMYVDHCLYGTLKIGWVFEKKMKYENCNDTYIQQTWVEVTNVLLG